MIHAASVAASIQFVLMTDGSQTKVALQSQIFSFVKSTPKYFPPGAECFFLNKLYISVASKPAFCASCLGIASKAFAYPLIINCPFPAILDECSLR